MRRCYSWMGREVDFHFETDETAERLAAALAFGSVTARVLGRAPVPGVDVLSAVFNLGIGLVDNVCDEDAEAGTALLERVRRHDLVEASAAPRERGWLRGGALGSDHAVAFTLDVIETFFQTLHEIFSGNEWAERRRRIGDQLDAALEAEHRTVARPAGGDVADLVECSRLTSVLPFEIVETIAGGQGAGTLLGEAMWRIDDLVDLPQDARSGALNSVLLQAPDIDHLLTSGEIARTAVRAAEDLEAALARADDRAGRSFLFFVQRYAGL
jgi:hypothetical protein